MTILFSVIICTYKRPDSLSRTLESVRCLEHDGDLNFEILVVDNDPKASAQPVVLEFARFFGKAVRYVHEPKQGKSNALNTGIATAKGDYLAFTDDDAVVDESWLKALYHCFQIHQCDCVGGRVEAQFPDNIPQWVKGNLDILCGPVVYHDYGEGTKLYQKPMVEFLGVNMAFTREAFESVGYYRTDIGAGMGTLGEDTEIFRRFIKNNNKIYYCGDAIVFHPVDPSRLTLKAIGEWNAKLGGYRFLVDEGAVIDQRLAYLFGIPRYLFRSILGSMLTLAVKIWNKREFLKTWVQLSQDIGKAGAIRKKYYEK